MGLIEKLFSMRADEKSLLQHLEQVVGPMTPLNDRDDPDPDWWFGASYRGRDVRIALSYEWEDGAKNVAGLWSVRFGVPLGGRPIELSIFEPLPGMADPSLPGTTALHTFSLTPALGRVLTGDADFDARFPVGALPAEAASFLLDAQARRWFVDAFAPEPNVRTEAGWLVRTRILRPTVSFLGQPATFPTRKPLENLPPPEQLAGWLEATIELTDRVTAGFDAAQAAIAREKGPAAAAEWLARQAAAQRAWARRRVWRMRAVVAIAVAIGAGIPLTVLCIVYWDFWNALVRALLSP